MSAAGQKPKPPPIGGVWNGLKRVGENVSDPASWVKLPDPPSGMVYTPAGDLQPLTGGEEAEKRRLAKEKALSGFRSNSTKRQVVYDSLRRAKEQAGWWSTGMGAEWLRDNVAGSDAKDLDATLDTIRANAAFDELQNMRNNSPTGGALGGIAVEELKMLQSTIGSLSQAQSYEQLMENLGKIENTMHKIDRQRREDFERQWGPLPRERPSAAPAKNDDVDALLKKYGVEP